MKLIKPSVEFWGKVPTDYGSGLEWIERAGRLCYKSEDRIGSGTAEHFVRRLIKSGHLAMVEHSNFVVKFTGQRPPNFLALQGELGKYLTVHLVNGELHVGGNLTAWDKRLDDFNETEMEVAEDPEVFTPFVNTFGHLFQIGEDEPGNRWQICPADEIPPALHRYTIKFTCDRGVSHELVRHRPCSFAQESTRYVNYGNKDMEFIEPWWWEEEGGGIIGAYFSEACADAEGYYKFFISQGLTPQAARAVLPNALKTEIVVTATSAQWDWMRKLRTAKDAHPDMQRVMNMVPWEEMGL